MTHEENLAWRKQQADERDAFHAQLAKQYGLDVNNKSEQMAWTLAWDLGHGTGYSEVQIYYEEIALIILQVYEECKCE